jgi:glyoxylate/hydroxypyruvate reductase A
MRAVLLMGSDDASHYRIELCRIIPDLDFRVYPDIGDIDDIEFLLIKRPLISDFGVFPNIKAIISLTVGLDQFDNVEVPSNIPILRMLDEGHVRTMAEFVLFSVMYYHRQIYKYESLQQKRIWSECPLTPPRNRSVGFMGFGAMAKKPAIVLRDWGFRVAAWRKSRKTEPGIQFFRGMEQLVDFLSGLDILVCLLPQTEDTSGILNLSTLSALPIGAAVINAGRGNCLNENDLIHLLDNNHLNGASLDVFQQEPLEKNSALWAHPKIRITPHIAGKADIPKAAEFIRRKIQELEEQA